MYMIFDEKYFAKKIPKKILKRIKENMEIYSLTLDEAFEEAVRTLAKSGSKLWKAWYYSDFREYVPCLYEPEYLDFRKYPLKYEGK